MGGLKELLATYEKSIERKDQVISNLTHAMQKQRDKAEMMRKFCDWKIKHNDHKREQTMPHALAEKYKAGRPLTSDGQRAVSLKKIAGQSLPSNIHTVKHVE